MAYNGSGTFALYTPGNPVVTGTTIASTWANNTLSDIATGLSTAVTKDGQTTTTARVPFAAGISAATPIFTGAVTEAKRAAVYVYTAWDPSDVAGTLTNASSSSSATVTAASYVTQANASGTLTNTAVVAGLFRFTVSGQNEFNAAITAANFDANTGGTATIYLGTAILKIFSFVTGALQPMSGTGVFYASMTVGQTVTILPKFSVTSGGVTTNFTQQCTVSAEYCGVT